VLSRFKLQDVCGIRILNSRKAQPLIEPSGAGALRTQTNTFETLPRIFDERRHKRSAIFLT